jgi:hypothetical protein
LHGERLLGLGDGEDAGDAGEHLFEAGDFLLEVAQSGIGEAVDAGGAAFGGHSGFRFEPSFPEHALEGRVEGAFFDLEELIGDLFDVLDESIAVHRAEAEGLEDHHFQGAGEEVAVFGIPGHTSQYRLQIPICKIVFL